MISRRFSFVSLIALALSTLFLGCGPQDGVTLKNCNPNPCQNGGSCQLDGESYTCTCQDGYSGTNCEVAPTPAQCAPNPCQNGGTCSADGAGYACACAEGFTGKQCEVPAQCATNPCKNGGTCSADGAGYACACADGFTGEQCEIPPQCNPNPCKNDGVCSADGDRFTCECKDPYAGTNCSGLKPGKAFVLKILTTKANDIFLYGGVNAHEHYTIDCNSDGKQIYNAGPPGWCTYSEPGYKLINVTGDFSRFSIGEVIHDAIGYMRGNTNLGEIEVIDWGPQEWSSMYNMFQGCSNLKSIGQTIPKLKEGASLIGMFESATNFNQDISGWDVSKVEDMRDMFSYALSFNQDISDWDVSKVNYMSGMFRKAVSFDQDLSKWNVSEVTEMDGMFKDAWRFNRDISGWNVSKVKYMREMFRNAESFDQDLSKWDVSNVTECRDFAKGATSWKMEHRPKFTKCDPGY